MEKAVAMDSNNAGIGQQPADLDVIGQVLAGRHNQYAVLVERYQRPLVNFLRRLLPCDEDVLDCVQEAFLAAYRNLWRYSPKFTFRAWLYTIARNKAYDMLRKSQGRENIELEEVLADPRPGPEDFWLVKEQALHLEEVLAAMPDHYRQALYLRYRQDLSYEEIALVLQVPVSRVKTYLHRGKERLRQLLERGEIHDRAGRLMDSTVRG